MNLIDTVYLIYITSYGVEYGLGHPIWAIMRTYHGIPKILESARFSKSLGGDTFKSLAVL